MNVFRNYVEHAERPKVRRWTSAATPNTQHLAASATRRGRPNKRVHQEKGQPENHEVVQSAQRRRERLATRPKNHKKCLQKRKRAKKRSCRGGDQEGAKLLCRGADAEEEAPEATGGTSRRGTSRFSAAARRAQNLFKETPQESKLTYNLEGPVHGTTAKLLHERTVHGCIGPHLSEQKRATRNEAGQRLKEKGEESSS